MGVLRSRSVMVALALTSAIAVLGACAPPPPYEGPPTANRTFQATRVTVNSTNDGWNITCFCTKDEPKNVHIGFRVKVGVPNSASASVVAGSNAWNGIFEQGLSAGQSHNYSGSQRAAVGFNDIGMPDVIDLVQGAPLEIAGVWAWKLEDDGILAANVNNVANAARAAMVTALNATIAQSSLPSDPSLIVNAILSAIGNLGFFNLFTTAITAILNNLNVLTDDVVGSAMYVGVGSSGTLAEIIDGVTGSVAFPSIAIPTVRVPPDIGGGAIFSLGTGTKTFSNDFTNGGVDGRHTTTYTFG
jgi:hypothetical protein